MISPFSLFLKISSTFSSAAGAYITYSSAWSDTLHPICAKNSILLRRASFRSAKSAISTPLTCESFFMYSGYSGFSRFIALSGRHAGSTFTSKLSSSARTLCHFRSSTGSSVVQINFTLDLRIMFLTDISSSCSFLLHRFHTSSAVSPFRYPVYPKYLCNSRWLQ